MVAGVSAAIVAAAQIAGGLLVPFAGRIFRKRTSALIAGTLASAAAMLLIGLAGNFWIVLVLLALWAVVFAAVAPIRQAYMNGIIPSAQRATVLSADNMMNSAGGVVAQPVLGKTAEVWGYPASYIGTAAIQALAVPFLVLARREKARSDAMRATSAASEKTS